MPQPPKPRKLKLLSGTVRADRDPGPQVVAPVLRECPPAPDWQPNVHAVREWERLAPILVANGLLTAGALSAFGMLCAVHGKLVQLWTAGETPHAALIAQYRNLCNDFGLTPIASGKVRPAAPERGPNRFASNGKPAA